MWTHSNGTSFALGAACNPSGPCGIGFVHCGDDGESAVCSTGPGGAFSTVITETCNALDDDCDGQTDEELPTSQSHCETIGVCDDPSFWTTCEAGTWVCHTHLLPAFESDETSCDELDNDCDGLTDEGQPDKGGVCDGDDADLCATGAWVCSADGGLMCVEDSGPLDDEICDGLDNDCDGLVDEGLTFDGAPVGDLCVGLGECGEGVVECANGGATCSTHADGSAPQGTAEICDGLDNDCDGATDDELLYAGEIAVGEACEGVGACGPGVVECGADPQAPPTCSSNPEGTEPGVGDEICNGADDDCDGATDEAFPEDGQRCDSIVDTDDCATGVSICAGGFLACSGDVACEPGQSCVDPGEPQPMVCE